MCYNIKNTFGGLAMKKNIVPVDVIRAGIRLYFEDINLEGYRKRKNDKNQLYKLIKTETGAVVTLSYNIKYQYFSMRASMPKVLYGTNTVDVFSEDIEKFILSMNDILWKQGIYFNYSDFKVSLLETSVNYVCDSESDKYEYIELFSKRSVARKRKDKYPTSVVFKNASTRVTIYDKSAEMESRKSETSQVNDKELPTNKKLLRIEHTLSKRALKNYHKDLSIHNILQNQNIAAIFYAEQRKAKFNLRVLREKELFKVLNKKIKHKRSDIKRTIKEFYRDINVYGENYVCQKYSPHQVRTYINLLVDDGYSPIAVQKAKRINFMNLSERKIEVKMNARIKNAIHKSITIFNQSVREILSHYFRCTFFQMVFKYWDTS